MSTLPTSLSVQQKATVIFNEWTPAFLLDSVKTPHIKLKRISADFLRICFEGMKVNQKSVYLTNQPMIQTLLAYDEWSIFVPTGEVGTHKKFKINAGILSHILKRIQLYEENPQKLNALNMKIKQTTKDKNLDELLQRGMFIKKLFIHLIIFFFFFVCL